MESIFSKVLHVEFKFHKSDIVTDIIDVALFRMFHLVLPAALACMTSLISIGSLIEFSVLFNAIL